MLGIPLRYVLKHPVQAAKDLAEDPLEIWTTIRETYVAEREQGRAQCPYESDDNWESRLHGYLGLAWPCRSDVNSHSDDDNVGLRGSVPDARGRSGARGDDRVS